MTATDTSGDWRTIGNEFAVKQLQGAVRLDRVSHAYLFTGPEQVGKRNLAIDLARSLCCTAGQDSGGQAQPPCGSCTVCDRVGRFAHPDVRLINVNTPASSDSDEEAAARRTMIGIELISDLQSDAVLEPYESAYRIFIIDGAHQMSLPAANALLKTLEEPPSAVRLLLTASSQDQLPATIVSRCHVINLSSVPIDTIRDALVSRYGASESDAQSLAALSGGNPGWAIAAHQDPSLVDAARESASRIVTTLTSELDQRFDYARQMSTQFRRDRPSVMIEVTRWTQLVRDLAFLRHGLDAKVATVYDLDQLKQLANQISDADIAAMLKSIDAARDALNANALPQLAFEVMMMETPTLRA